MTTTPVSSQHRSDRRKLRNIICLQGKDERGNLFCRDLNFLDFLNSLLFIVTNITIINSYSLVIMLIHLLFNPSMKVVYKQTVESLKYQHSGSCHKRNSTGCHIHWRC